MNILYYWSERAGYMDQWQRIHIFDELKRNGHTIQVFNPLNYKSIAEANERLLSKIKMIQTPINLFMSCTESDLLYKDTIENIKAIGLPTLLICFDNLQAPFIHKKTASSFDLVWLTSKENMGMFKKWGCQNLLFLPYAANPYNFFPNYSKEIYSIGFIGNPYGSRINKLNYLLKNDLPCTIYSDSLLSEKNEIAANETINYLNYSSQIINLLQFKIGRIILLAATKNKLLIRQNLLKENVLLDIKPSVSFHEMNSIYSNHALSLNITELRNTFVLDNPIHKLHLRTFEIPMCGGLQFSLYNDELSNYFEDGKEIVFYNSDEELISKSKFYLNRNSELLRIKMKKKARYRAVSEHTWTNRFKIIFSNI